MEIRPAAPVAVVSLVLAGCIAGNPEPPAPIDPGELSSGSAAPAWVQELPQGVQPRDDVHTRRAEELLRLGAFTSGEEREGYLEEALGEARQAIEADSTNPLPWLQAGRAELGLDRPVAAGTLLERAEELHPRYLPRTMTLREEAWMEEYAAGVAREEAGEAEAAVQHFLRAHRIYSLRPEAMLRLATIHHAQGRRDEALAALDGATGLLTGPWHARMDPGTRAEWDASLAWALRARGEILLELERYGDAAEVYAELLALDPDDAAAHSLRAAALVASGEAARAGRIFAELLEREGLDASDYFAAALGLFEVGEYEAAADAFREAHARVPQHRDAAIGLSQALYLTGRWDELLAVSEHLLRIDPLNRDAFQLRAQALSGADRSAEVDAIVDEMRRLPFSVDALAFRPSERGVVLAGVLTNRNRPPGSVVRFRIHFYDASGIPVGSGDQAVELGPAGEPVSFQVAAPSVAGLFGYRYQVLGG